MTSIIRFTALSGAQNEDPPCYLLQVDEFRFLLDCGWDENLSLDVVENIRRHANSVDAILISHPDVYHMGALPYLMANCNLNCPIYTTIPVYKMGQMFLYDFYQSHQNYEAFEHFSLDDVDAAFDKIIQLKYSQHVSLKGRGHGLSITPFAAGHMIGGTMWKIMKEGEEDIIYAVDFNHKKEIHLNGAVLETINRPALLITDSYTALTNQARRKDRDVQLMNTILSAVRKDGNVLLAVDTAGRILELIQLLDQLWRLKDSGLSVYSLSIINNVSYNVVEFAKSQVEWMSDRMMKSFEANRSNPFSLKQIIQCHTLKDLEQIPSPKVVLASTADLNSGFSRELFMKWASNPKNSIIFTYKTAPGSLARKLIDNPKLEVLQLEVKEKVQLEGSELVQFLEQEKERMRQKKLLKKSLETESRHENVFKEESDDDDDDDETMEDKTINKSKYDLMLTDEKLRHKSSFFKQAKIYPMFPYKEERLKWDDYGEIIKCEEYTINEPALTEEEVIPEEKLQDIKEDLETLEITEIPSKSVSRTVSLDIRCQISYIDFEGRSDGESVKRILSLVKPRQLILIHGTRQATKSLSEYCQKSSLMNISEIFTPEINEVIDATRESHIYQVKLKDSLVSSLRFSQTQDSELAWVDGQLIMEQRGEKFDRMETDQDDEEKYQKKDVVPVLEQLPPGAIPSHTTVFIDEPRLSDFKQVLTKSGIQTFGSGLPKVFFNCAALLIMPNIVTLHRKRVLSKDVNVKIQAEFAGGVLVCNNTVAVRRNESGKITIEGGLCEEYYTIRELLYQQYAIV